MKRLALVSLFAATLAAQQAPPAPPKAVAAAIAVEEQEGDLDKAERLYRDLLADEKLPATARSTVNLRLGRLLQKLGKSEAAKPFLQAAKGDVVSLDDITGFDDFGPQDAAREKALRAEAQALLEEPGDLIASDISWDQLAGPLPERLLWIGRPAVPAIIATLENTSLSAQPGTGLFALLWRIGGVQAQAFLAQSLKDPTRCITAARAAAAAPDGDMLDFAGKQLFVVDWPTARTMLSHNTYASPRDLQGRLGSNLLLDLADRGNAEVQAYVLDLFRTSGVDDLAAASRYVALVRRGLASTEPVLGTAAERCLSADFTQGSMAGLELLFDMLPSHAELKPRWVGLPADVVDQRHGMAADAAAHRLWPKAVHSALSLATDHPGRSWLSQMLRWIGGSLDAAAAPEVFHLLDAGYPVAGLVANKITPDNAAEVLARADRVPASDREKFVGWLRDVELPKTVLPALRDLAAEWYEKNNRFPVVKFAFPMARTGASEAAAWMVACPLPSGWGPPAEALLELARRNQSEEVRAAMRQMLQRPGNSWDSELTLALLSMHDEPTLELVQTDMRKGVVPYATAPEPAGLTPLQYLLYDHPDPPHGFGVQDVRRVLTRMSEHRNFCSPADYAIDRIGDPMLQLLAEMPFGTNVGRYWQQDAIQRYRERKGGNGWREWLNHALSSAPARVRILEQLDAAEVDANLSTIESLRNDPETAVAATEALLRAGKPIDLAALLNGDSDALKNWALNRVTNGHGKDVPDEALLPLLQDPNMGTRRSVVIELGGRVSVAAVPELIRLLRDPTQAVRDAASDALTKIRFFHEQQAHWDRVFKGIDASATSAAEKLLLQAKPGQPKAQRLLAITSLGTLGVPEALPFLIDWTTDPDADIAASAKAVITEIHLHPRR